MEHRRIPNSLKRFRRLTGLSQKQAAAILGLHPYRLGRWEKGKSLPGMEYLFRLSILYRTPPNNLYLEYWQIIKESALRREEELLAPAEPISTNDQNGM
jgi:transcriptional regulator with XRE-family HTH domain